MGPLPAMSVKVQEVPMGGGRKPFLVRSNRLNDRERIILRPLQMGTVTAPARPRVLPSFY